MIQEIKKAELCVELFEDEINNSDEISNLSIEDLEFLSTKDVAKILGCSLPTARKLFHRDDFPALLIGNSLKVLKQAFINWCREKRL